MQPIDTRGIPADRYPYCFILPPTIPEEEKRMEWKERRLQTVFLKVLASYLHHLSEAVVEVIIGKRRGSVKDFQGCFSESSEKNIRGGSSKVSSLVLSRHSSSDTPSRR